MPLLEPSFENHSARLAGSFDTIVAFDVFEHFTQQQIRDRLAAAAVLLKPGGGLVLRFPNGQSPFGLAPQYGDATHVTPLSLGAVVQLLGETPLSVERYTNAFRNTGSGVTSVVRRMRFLARDVGTRLLGWAYALSIPWDPVVTIVLRKRNLD